MKFTKYDVLMEALNYPDNNPVFQKSDAPITIDDIKKDASPMDITGTDAQLTKSISSFFGKLKYGDEIDNAIVVAAKELTDLMDSILAVNTEAKNNGKKYGTNIFQAGDMVNYVKYDGSYLWTKPGTNFAKGVPAYPLCYFMYFHVGRYAATRDMFDKVTISNSAFTEFVNGLIRTSSEIMIKISDECNSRNQLYSKIFSPKVYYNNGYIYLCHLYKRPVLSSDSKLIK